MTTGILPIRRFDPLAAARDVAADAHAAAEGLDVDGAFPTACVESLHASGLLAAPLAAVDGGADLQGLALAAVLRRIGGGSLPLGRLYEGHVNAVGLVRRYGSAKQHRMIAQEVCEGQVLGVWNTDDAENLWLRGTAGRYRLEGRKILCSGAGCIGRPLVTATDEAGQRLMVLPRLEPGERADLSRWTPQGMRASATGTVDFTGIAVDPIEILGADGDYHRQPVFSGGAWRFAAVQQGAMERLLDLLRAHLRRTGRGGDPHQAARLGQAAIQVETARLWIESAAVAADGVAAEQIVAYVNLVRLAVERAALDLVELVQRSVGLQGFMRPNPIERIARDLATYLRQPAPDRALTEAAAWVLAEDREIADLWG